jgi:hypothetical protein
MNGLKNLALSHVAMTSLIFSHHIFLRTLHVSDAATMSRCSTTFPAPKGLLLSSLYTLLLVLPYCASFSAPNIGFDRFRVSCPADASCIQQYDSSLSFGENEVWAAVYRSNHNLPTVLLKDDFLNSMRIATTDTKSSLIETAPPRQATPVAVARLCRSPHFPNRYTLDNMRCWLKKETLDDSCDGGSEHAEALCCAIDALVLHHLTETTDASVHNTTTVPVFEGVIRTKATLVSGVLLEQRGFQAVEKLDQDMATHISSLETCLEQYAKRTLEAPMKSNAQAVALQILSKLGLLDVKEEMQAASKLMKEEQDKDSRDDDDDYDPWAGMKQYI